MLLTSKPLLNHEKSIEYIWKEEFRIMGFVLHAAVRSDEQATDRSV